MLKPHFIFDKLCVKSVLKYKRHLKIVFNNALAFIKVKVKKLVSLLTRLKNVDSTIKVKGVELG